MNYDKIENIKKLLGPPYNYEVKLINDLFIRQLGDLNRQWACDAFLPAAASNFRYYLLNSQFNH